MNNHEELTITIPPWMQTHSDIKFDPYNIKPEDISILDIAHSLANTCRWGGHCKEFYSVAQHSIEVMHRVSPPNKLAALLHDAAETYIGDMPSPIKATLPDYKRLEEIIMTAIADKFEFQLPLNQEIKDADKFACIWEAHNLLRDTALVEQWGGKNPEPYRKIKCWSPATAKYSFIHEFERLTESNGAYFTGW